MFLGIAAVDVDMKIHIKVIRKRLLHFHMRVTSILVYF